MDNFMQEKNVLYYTKRAMYVYVLHYLTILHYLTMYCTVCTVCTAF